MSIDVGLLAILMWSVVMLTLGLMLRLESTRWRYLMQLYLESQAGKQLPVEPGPTTGPVSELRIPKDLLAELERREADMA